MSKVNFQALGPNVLLEIKEVEKTKSGIYLPDKIKEERQLQDFLKVLSVGEDVSGIFVGDEVMLKGNVKIETINIEDKDYLLVYQGIIVGKKINL